ncbi:MAG: hypothetical protein KIS92_26645, partial [Planctomycetota bacterium]|nr:hypothetical protein [Planctomycetota bacterium]
RHLLIEAHGPGLDGLPVRLMKLESVVYAAGTPAEKIYEKIVAREFESLAKVADTRQDKPSLSHGSAISDEDRRRYARILGIERGITACAWQAKIPRVMTEIIEHLKTHDAYQKETRSYYDGRADEAERREAIARYVQKEIKYRAITEPQAEARVNELAELTQQLYARQQTVFDPRLFVPGGPATKGSTPFILDLHLSEMRLRRGIHRFYTGARLKDQQVFMGEAMVTGQPLVTKEMANFLCEINHSFNTLRLFEYRPRG